MESLSALQNKNGTAPKNPLCEFCDDLGWVVKREGSTRCKCLIQKIKIRNIGEEFADVKLYHIKPKNETQTKIKAIMLKNPYGSYYIYGDLNMGKTHFLSALYNKALDDGYIDTTRFTKDKIFKKHITEWNFDREKYCPINYELFENREIKWLFWDDVGKSDMSSFFRQEIYAIIDLFRSNPNTFRLVMTSTFSLDELASPDYLGSSTIRRIEDLCEIIRLK